MAEGGMSAGDVLALTRGNNDMFGGNWGGIIGLLIIAGIFGGGLFGFGGNRNVNSDYVTQAQLYSGLGQQDLKNDVRDGFTATAAGQSAISTEILNSKYENLLQFKDMQASNDRCCCELKNAIHAEGEATRGLISGLDRERLQYELSQANTAIANAVQTNNILNTIGQWYSKPSVNPYNAYGCGCNNNFANV